MRAFVISMADVAACPQARLDVKHFRDDGSCRCFPDPVGELAAMEGGDRMGGNLPLVVPGEDG